MLKRLTGMPDSIVQLLRPVGGSNDGDALLPIGHTIKLHQELGFQPAGRLVLARRPL